MTADFNPERYLREAADFRCSEDEGSWGTTEAALRAIEREVEP